MSGDTLEPLLRTIASGEHTPEQLAHARRLLHGDDRFPDELSDALDDDMQLGADALLGLLGVDDGLGDLVSDAVEESAGWDVADSVMGALFPTHAEPPVAEAVRDEAGEVQITRQVIEELERSLGPVGLAETVRQEAGTVDVVACVLAEVDQAWLSALLDRELSGDSLASALAKLHQRPGDGLVMTHFADLGRELRAALVEEAGEVTDLWSDVAPVIGIANPEAVLGWDGQVFTEAVRQQAGEIDLADAIMARVRSRALPEAATVPAPANDNRWQIAGLAVAAVALLVISVGFPGDDAPPKGFPASQPLVFASADEIVVNELSVGDNATATVYRGEGENAPVIILVNEEIVL